MACGNPEQVIEHYWTICDYEFRYPCGIRWCRRWGIPYPCRLNYCTDRMPYPCRRTRTVTKFCYDFSVIHESCLETISKLILASIFRLKIDAKISFEIVS